MSGGSKSLRLNEVPVLRNDDVLKGRMWSLRFLAAGLLVVFVAEWIAGRDDLGIASIVVAAAWVAAELLWWLTHRRRPGTEGSGGEDAERGR